MHMNHPEIAKRWDTETARRPHKTKVRSAANKAFGDRY